MKTRLELLIPPPVQALLSALAMWGIVTLWPHSVLAFPLQGVVATALIVTGLAIDLVSIHAFQKAGTTITPLAPDKTSRLVVEGLYRFTRNPMYVGLLAILAGIAVWLGSPLNIAVLLAFVTYMTVFQIKPEETRLAAKFGADYAGYCQSVRRWL